MPTLTQLIKAKGALERELESVKHKIAEELGLNSVEPVRSRRRRSRRGRHKMSAEARKKIGLAQKRRWAEKRKEEKKEA